MEITVAGTGRVGTALAAGFSRVGHHVTLAARNSDSTTPGIDGTTVVGLSGAADRAAVLVLAVPFAATADALAAVAPPAGTIVVDVSNPFCEAAPEGFGSTTQWLASRHPNLRLVKAFNVLGAEHMANPGFAGDARAVLPVAGDDADARASIVELANEMGFEAVGGLDAAGTLEAAARYWGLLAFAGGLGRGIALGVLHGR